MKKCTPEYSNDSVESQSMTHIEKITEFLTQPTKDAIKEFLTGYVPKRERIRTPDEIIRIEQYQNIGKDVYHIEPDIINAYVYCYTNLKNKLSKMNETINEMQKQLRIDSNALIENKSIREYFFNNDKMDKFKAESVHNAYEICKKEKCFSINYEMSDNEKTLLLKKLTILQKQQWILCNYYIEYADRVKSLRRILRSLRNARWDNTSDKIHQKSSQGELDVMNLLIELQKQCKYKLFFFYKHKWSFCKNINTLEYDFYCIVINGNKMVQIEIEFNGDQHYNLSNLFASNRYHQCDVIKENFLIQMNIHQLVLQKDFSIGMIDAFINKKVRDSDYNMINHRFNYMNYNKKILSDTSKHNGIKYFNDYVDDSRLLLECEEEIDKCEGEPLIEYTKEGDDIVIKL